MGSKAMENVNLSLLKDELKTQLHAYRFNKPAEDLLNYVKNTVQGTDRSKNIQEDFERILAAKNDWESCVDALEHQAMILLDNDLKVIRANRTVELWGWAEVKTIAGMHILNLIKPAIENDSVNDWVGEWCQLDIQENVEWESNNYKTGRKFRFSFYPNRDIDSLYHNDNCYAVMLISDITNQLPAKLNKSHLLHAEIEDDLKSTLTSSERAEQKAFNQYNEQRMHQLAEQLINSQEFERKRVSSELHDGVGQILSALKYQVESVVIDSNNSSRQRKNDLVLNNVLDNIKTALSELRRISVDLRPSILEDLGLLMTLRWFAGEFNKVYTDFNVEVLLDVSESDISDDRKNVIYRIVQEAMNNAAKYSHATKIFLQLTKSDVGLLLRISDDGCGFDIDQVKTDKDSGLGLKNMQDRAVNSGADFNLSSNTFVGTTIQVFWKED